MAKPWDVTSDDIDLWSQRIEAQALLPDLVRRLLLATAPLSSLSMSAHAGTRLPGWDGIVRASSESAFCPAGLSVWELTVESDKTKFSGDLTKRTADPGAVTPRDTTYVAVSSRRISRKDRWATEKKAENPWREIRLLDADDLAAWLSQAPAVARWFAAQLDRPADDIEDLDGFLEAFRRRTHPPLPLAIALAGQDRARLAESVRAFARSSQHEHQKIKPLRVHGDTWEEAAVFAAAALALDPTPEGEQVRARTVVVRSEAALRSALNAEKAQPLVVIAAFERATASVGPIVLPLEGPLPAAALDVLRLAQVPYRRFAEILTASGMPEAKAMQVAGGSGGKLSALQRLLGYVELPRWAQGVDARPLSAMLLAGAFEPGNAEDRDVLKVLGADPDEVEMLCERLRVGPDAPTLKEQGRSFRAVWRWRSEEDAWRALAGQIPAAVLRGFGEVVRLVLGERDPKLDLKPDERFAAALHGKVLRASGPLREGLVRTLVRLSLNDEALAPLHGPQQGSVLAKIVVRDLLPPPWAAWASLAQLLPLLAEAAPEMFLDCLEASLREGETGAAHLLAEESSIGGSPHTGLLWALETLGWDERLFPRVAAALATLAQHDAKLERPGRLANRPSNSLTDLLRLWCPQTTAPIEARIAEMERRLRDTPDVGFPMLVHEIASLGGGGLMSPGRSPELRPIAVLSMDELLQRTEKEIEQLAKAYMQMALDHAGHDDERWAYFLKHARVHGYVGEQVLDRLEVIREQLHDKEAKVWNAIREILSWSEQATESASSEEQETSEEEASAPDPGPIYGRWERLYQALEPDALELRYAWLFEPHPRVPQPFERQQVFEAVVKDLQTRRQKAVEEIGQQPDRLRIMSALAERIQAPIIFGSALGQATFARELDASLIESAPPASLAPVVPAYLAARWQVEGQTWFEAKLRVMAAQGRTEEIKKTFRLFQGSTVIWDLIDGLSDEVRRSYWKDLDYVFGEHSKDEWERALKNLLAAGNTVGALLNAESAKENISLDTIAGVLKAFVADPRQVVQRGQEGVSSWVLEQLMDRLEASPEVETKYAGLLANVEFTYALYTYDPKRPMRRLSAAFAANPDQFVDLVTRMYRPRGEPRPTQSEAEEAEARQRALGAHRVLGAWTGYPGQGLPTHEGETVLYDWSLKVLRSLAAVNRAETGASEVAKVLARAPAAADGFWPNLAARRLLETDEFPVLLSRMKTAEYNLRNGEFRPISGETERATSAEFRQAARALRLAYPRTATMLDSLAESYESSAVRHEADEEVTLREEGAEPADFGEPPARPAPSPKRRVLRPGVVSLEKIEVTNFAIVDRLTIELKPKEDRGQWVMLLGDNGRGKTTLLRALALALEGTNVAQAALSQYVAPLIRVGADTARGNVTCGGADFSFALTNDGTGEVATCEPANGPRPPVFGYGCRRGSALGGGDAGDLTSPFSDVATLFSESARLQSARIWLKDLKLRALQEPKYDAIFQTITKKLCGLLLDVEHLDVAGNEVWVIAPKLGGRVLLRSLSDGYLTTLGWLVDLIARWLHWAEQVQADLTGDFFERMEGLVLIDELDLHLHPRWQQSIVKTLKDTFPRLSFVVTTHNPLTLVGAEEGEIVVLRERTDGSGCPEAKQIDLPAGTRADRILTGEWFGLRYTVDDETIALIEKHQRMLLAQVPEDDAERRKLEEELAQRYGTYADTSLDRMALEVAAELMAEQRPRTYEERKSLRDKLKERVKEKLSASRRESEPKG
jgi:energy-coupling factor transporter ATP-binding protein EcfA2